MWICMENTSFYFKWTQPISCKIGSLRDLENFQNVIFDPEKQINFDRLEKTTLTAWFEFNSQQKQDLGLIYKDIPTLCTWDSAQKKWKLRKKKLKDVIAPGFDSWLIMNRIPEEFYPRILCPETWMFCTWLLEDSSKIPMFLQRSMRIFLRKNIVKCLQKWVL